VNNFRSVNSYLIIAFLVVSILKLWGIFSLSWTEIFSYASMFWGIGLFYYSFLKNNPGGIFIGALLFQIGILLFLNAKFELSEPKRIFIPAIMSIIGFSLLLINLVDKSNKYRLSVALIISFTGILLIIFRGQFDPEMFFYSALEITKDFWIILIVLALIILFTAREFSKEKKDQN
jgi:hypothetical protein